ncbi:hypothetical protein GTQ43_08255 [Nostoc sp. KVJ3]|nr:hypothetical protein [Nostoc sp. KVJ3]MCW5313798.1 hypothetical protein [Nostoc sp. KVJ3]
MAHWAWSIEEMGETDFHPGLWMIFSGVILLIDEPTSALNPEKFLSQIL